MPRLIAALTALALSAGCALATQGSNATSSSRDAQVAKDGGRTLRPFTSVQQLRKAMASVTEARVAARKKDIAKWREPCRAWAKSDFEVGVTCSGVLGLTETVTVNASATTAESITNTQHAGVDEGGIVRTLSLTAIRLTDQPRVAGTLLQPDAFQSEQRSHAFFYREDSPETGLFGLPIVTTDLDPEIGSGKNSARVLFVRNIDLTFASAGTLDAMPGLTTDDGCRASCADWYGNARPVFVGDRIFALLGYEIVEGRLEEGGVRHIRRLGFMPRAASR